MPDLVAVPPWSGWSSPASVEELLAQVAAFAATQPGGAVWRGQSCKLWGLSSSLWRLLGHPDELEMRIAERTTLIRAHDWGIGIHPTGVEVDQQVLACLQHHGAPTRFMDVTTNPLVAVWFASATSEEVGDGVVFGIRRSDLEVLRTGGPAIHGYPTYGSGSDPAGWHYKEQLRISAAERMPFIVDPVIRNDRIRAQGGTFLAWAIDDNSETHLGGLSGEKLNLSEMGRPSSGLGRALCISAVVVAEALKPEVRRVLAESYDISETRLFPDVQGVAENLRREPPNAISSHERVKAVDWQRACEESGLEARLQGAAIRLSLGSLSGLLLPDERGGVMIQFRVAGGEPPGWRCSTSPLIDGGSGEVFELHVMGSVDLAKGVEALRSVAS